jgi:pimeloyl-ACP methyl ester carboxylesterase
VIALDLPGFGRSAPLPDGAEPTPAALAEAVIAFLDELGLDRPVVAGNSLGGWISLEVARRGRARAAGPIDPAGFQLPRERLYSTNRLRLEVALARRADPHLLPLVRSPLTRTVFFAPMVARPWRIGPDEAEEAVHNLATSPGFDATLDALSRLTFQRGEEITVPVALMWGTRDHLLIPRQAPRAERVLPTARLHWLRGAGHVPMWDAPGEISRVLLDL